MDKKLLKTAEVSSGNKIVTALSLARVSVVYYLVSLFISALNPIAVNAGVVDFPLQQVFGDIAAYTTGLTEGGMGYFASTTLTAIAYILLAGMIVLSISLVLSIFDGTPKKIAVTAMAIAFGVTAICCGVAGVLSFTAGGEMAVQKPYSFLAAALFLAAAICCVISLRSKANAAMYAKEVDTEKIGGKLTAYFTGSAAEVKKIVWPDRKTVLKNTGIVLIFILLIGALIALTDWLWGFLFSLLLGR